MWILQSLLMPQIVQILILMTFKMQMLSHRLIFYHKSIISETRYRYINVCLLPYSIIFHQDEREDVRTWVLSVVTDGGVDQRLPSRENVRNSLYEGLFSSDKPSCIVTGFPVQSADVLEVNNSIANRKDWNIVVNIARHCAGDYSPNH